MIILAIDPGPETSGWVLYDSDRRYLVCGEPDADRERVIDAMGAACDLVAIEMIASYGMAVGASVFETCCEIGHFEAAALRLGLPTRRVKRGEVKLALCKSARAKDANIRQALLDRWGGRAAAVGRKKTPGPLYGCRRHMWAALAVAVTVAEGQR